MHSSKSSQSSGYGLGSSAFSQFGGLNGLESRGLGASYSPARSSFSEEALGSQESTTSTAFLEPFGGADNVKFYPPPSPLKPQPAQDVSPTEHSCMPKQGCSPHCYVMLCALCGCVACTSACSCSLKIQTHRLALCHSDLAGSSIVLPTRTVCCLTS